MCRTLFIAKIDTDRTTVNFRTARFLSAYIAYRTADAEELAVMCFEVVPSNIEPSRDVIGVNAEDRVYEFGQTFCEFDFETVGREQSDNRQSELSLCLGVGRVTFRRRHCVNRLSVAVDAYYGVFCEQSEDNFIQIYVGFDFADAKVACVDIKLATRVVQTEQNLAIVVEFLTRKLDEQGRGVVFGADFG